jgi:hypothetical protein
LSSTTARARVVGFLTSVCRIKGPVDKGCLEASVTLLAPYIFPTCSLFGAVLTHELYSHSFFEDIS